MVDMHDHLSRISDWLVYSDDDILVVNKPSGLLSIPDGYDPTQPCLSILLAELFGWLWVVHRLDKETSGVILLARNSEAHRRLNIQFDRREVTKIYHALIAGSPPWQRTEIDLPLRVNGDRRHRTVVDNQKGKPAKSDVAVLTRYSVAALVQVLPFSGYTHQIRAHLAAVGYPILFDPLYHRTTHPPNPSFNTPGRMALHAHQIRFHHPASGRYIQLEAPYPDDFRTMLNALERSLLD